jgi:hypothetical protein
MTQYEIRYLRKDGSTTLIHELSCNSDGDARGMAAKMTRRGFHSVEIWKSDICICKYALDAGKEQPVAL